MNREIELFINNEKYSITGADCFTTLADYLRINLGLVGTKVMCREGDCGACTVLVGRIDPITHRWHYTSIDSCIQFVFQLEAAHIITIEGYTRSSKDLAAVQQSMISNHASQCGFCTPGFVMSIAGFCENSPAEDLVNPDRIREGLSGNLCRCTGYQSIEEAVNTLHDCTVVSLDDFADHEMMEREYFTRCERDILIVTSDEDPQTVFVPATLESALEYYSNNPRATIISGATDVGVWHCKSAFKLEHVICINRLEELQGCSVEEGDESCELQKAASNTAHVRLRVGAGCTWSQVKEFLNHRFQEFDKLLSFFGSPQIRHSGTVGGNIVNGSPIADSLPAFYALRAKLKLESREGVREVYIDEFYTGYKKNVLKNGELLTEISLDVPSIVFEADETSNEKDWFRLYKVSRRRDMDISTFTAAIRIRLASAAIKEGEAVARCDSSLAGSDDYIQHATIALGGVGPMIVRAHRAEEFLVGKRWSLQIAHQAGRIAAEDVAPITDVRGTEVYRRRLCENALLRFYNDVSSTEVGV